MFRGFAGGLPYLTFFPLVIIVAAIRRRHVLVLERLLRTSCGRVGGEDERPGFAYEGRSRTLSLPTLLRPLSPLVVKHEHLARAIVKLFHKRG